MHRNGAYHMKLKLLPVGPETMAIKSMGKLLIEMELERALYSPGSYLMFRLPDKSAAALSRSA